MTTRPEHGYRPDAPVSSAPSGVLAHRCRPGSAQGGSSRLCSGASTGRAQGHRDPFGDGVSFLVLRCRIWRNAVGSSVLTCRRCGMDGGGSVFCSFRIPHYWDFVRLAQRCALLSGFLRAPNGSYLPTLLCVSGALLWDCSNGPGTSPSSRASTDS